MALRPVCVLVLGDPPPAIAAAHGEFVDWFAALWRGDPIAITAVRADRPAALPDVRHYAGLVMTGSPASMAAPEPWMEGPVELVRDAARAGTPVLGVCFGHQIIGAAYGAAVVPNPGGWEVGTHAVELTGAGRADPLFAGLDGPLAVNCSHRDAVDARMLSPINGARVLARNPRTDVQAIGAGDAIRGVQFHPEITGQVMAAYARERWADLATDAAARAAPDDHPDRVVAGARDCPDGVAVFRNFTRHWILKA